MSSIEFKHNLVKEILKDINYGIITKTGDPP